MLDDDYRELLNAKLAPANVLATLAFAGLIQITFELAKQAIVDGVRDFYTIGFTPREDRYARDVLSLNPQSKFLSSAQWLVKNEAITGAQVEVLERLRKHRHDIAHELAKYLVDLDFEPDIMLFGEALGVLRDIHRFWIQIEIDIGSFEAHGDVTVDDAVPGVLIALQFFIDSYVDSIERLHKATRDSGAATTELRSTPAGPSRYSAASPQS